MKALRPILVILTLLILDQSLKFWVKLNFLYGESRTLIDGWRGFQLYFIENEGMAFGMTIGGALGKLALSIFRIVAVVVIGYLLFKSVKKNAASGFIVALSMIFAGALGNILDSVFYGVLFSESSGIQHAVLFPADGGYSGFLHGRVVDMLYFPIIHGVFPDWIPFAGGDYFIFFRPIFNIADASITSGVLLIILFQRKFFPSKKKLSNDDTIIVSQ